MYNKVILMGRICHDLELKITPNNGVPVLSFRLAADRRYQVKGEERKADFFNIVAWRSTAEFIAKYFSKGRMIMLDGELQTRQYIDKNNVTQNVVEIVVDSVHFTGEKAVTQQLTYSPPNVDTTSPQSNVDTTSSSSNVDMTSPPSQSESFTSPDSVQMYFPAQGDFNAQDDDYPF